MWLLLDNPRTSTMAESTLRGGGPRPHAGRGPIATSLQRGCLGFHRLDNLLTNVQ